MSIETNHSLSSDCVIFGFNGVELKVLLIESKESVHKKKLPGSMILENETLPNAANRILLDNTGLEGIYLKKVAIYSDPDRVSSEDLEWINRNHGVDTRRVVTVGYYALLKLDSFTIRHTSSKGAHWVSLDSIGELMMDHNKIVEGSLNMLRAEVLNSPIAFELLPRRFTLNSLRILYRAILSIEIDHRNFRRKLLNSGLFTPTGRYTVETNGKKIELYTFNRSEYNKQLKRGLRLSFL